MVMTSRPDPLTSRTLSKPSVDAVINDMSNNVKKVLSYSKIIIVKNNIFLIFLSTQN